MTAASAGLSGLYRLADSGHGCLALCGHEFTARFVPGILPGGDAALFQPVQELARGRGLAIGVIIVQGIISAIPVIGKYMPAVIELGH